MNLVNRKGILMEKSLSKGCDFCNEILFPEFSNANQHFRTNRTLEIEVEHILNELK